MDSISKTSAIGVLRVAFFLVILVASFSCKKHELALIVYDSTGAFGDNILSKNQTDFANTQNSLECNLPEGKNVKIVITGKTFTGGAMPTGIWRFENATVDNWSITSFDKTKGNQAFTSIEGGQICDLKMIFDKGVYTIDYYENSSSTITLTKTITINN